MGLILLILFILSEISAIGSHPAQRCLRFGFGVGDTAGEFLGRREIVENFGRNIPGLSERGEVVAAFLKGLIRIAFFGKPGL